MNNKAGFWSAFGAIAGGVVGAAAAKYAVRLRYDVNVEDAMVLGGAAGAVIGAFVGGAASTPKELAK
jgi:hypothetical protein